MTNLLSENPWPAILLGGVALAVLVGLLVRTRRWVYAVPALLVVVLTAALVWLEASVVTPREELAGLIFVMAEELSGSDPARVLRHVSDGAPKLAAHGKVLLEHYHVHRAKVKSNLQIEFSRSDETPQAEARFNAVFHISERRGSVKNLLSPWYFIVRFVREEGTWKVVSYERLDPREGLRTAPSRR